MYISNIRGPNTDPCETPLALAADPSQKNTSLHYSLSSMTKPFWILFTNSSWIPCNIIFWSSLPFSSPEKNVSMFLVKDQRKYQEFRVRLYLR